MGGSLKVVFHDYTQAPYKESDFEIAMSANKRYECGDNFFKMDMQYNGSKSVPINAKSVDRIVQHHLKTPTALPLPFYIAVKTGSTPRRPTLGI